ncbi:MAG TPA: type II toxin-antitoxin system RatA family toxin [Rhodanobacteraceae bacterium]|jgi:ribosome-associated toxin RatA of RatAB toxin-antitoxin module|nr:type II toxin-antitoxin system RatA family toxin [Rhodanobacteraceae bacterium]
MKIHRQALVRFTPEQMFDLVNDVEAYPRRFHWCLGAKVSEHDGEHLVARLDLRFAGITQHFSTRNTLDRPSTIKMQFVDGPFDWLHGVWQFTPLGGALPPSGPAGQLPPQAGEAGVAQPAVAGTPSGTKVALDLDFEVSNRLTGFAFRIGFQKLADRMVDDFCDEAKRAYA